MGKLIDSHEAIKIITSYNGTVDKSVAKRLLLQMPSAEPERKKGKWIDYSEDGFVECPFCHNATNCDGNKDELHYCFSCGAELEDEDEIN